MTTAAPAPYHVCAYNTAHDSENKIHDDVTARAFGFGGGLVPGVDVYGYMTHMPVTRWGRAWLERGTAECRFFKPVYDGQTATVTAAENGGELELLVESRGERCAIGRAALPQALPNAPPLESFCKVKQNSHRPPADEISLAVGTWLGLDPYEITPEMAAQHRADLREKAALYADEMLIHPAMVLRACNFVINRNVALGPWIHVSSRVQHLGAAQIGSSLSARGHVTANYEHKGHRFVDVDVVVLVNDERPIALVVHRAIYRLRAVIEG